MISIQDNMNFEINLSQCTPPPPPPGDTKPTKINLCATGNPPQSQPSVLI